MLKQRILTALVLAPIAIGGVFFLPSEGFSLFIAAIVVLAGWEWANMAGLPRQVARWGYSAVLALLMVAAQYINAELVLGVAVAWWLCALLLIMGYPGNVPWWRHTVVKLIMGFLVLVPAWKGLVSLHAHEHGKLFILFVFLLVWGADVGAYFAGRRFGKRKLAPKVSPGKTWEGVAGGLIGVTVIAFALGAQLELTPTRWLGLLFTAWLVMGVSIVGDLLESALKRERGIKDSSQLLPGHGGIMDRIDSLTAAVPMFVFALFIIGV